MMCMCLIAVLKMLWLPRGLSVQEQPGSTSWREPVFTFGGVTHLGQGGSVVLLGCGESSSGDIHPTRMLTEAADMRCDWCWSPASRSSNPDNVVGDEPTHSDRAFSASQR